MALASSVAALVLLSPSAPLGVGTAGLSGTARASERCCIVSKFGFAPLVLARSQRVWGVALWRMSIGHKNDVTVYGKRFRRGARGFDFVRLPIEFRRSHSGRLIYRFQRTLLISRHGRSLIAVGVDEVGDHQGVEIPSRIRYGVLTRDPISGDSVFRMLGSYCTTQDASETPARRLPHRNSSCRPV